MASVNDVEAETYHRYCCGWMGQRNHQLIDGKHPMILGFNHPKLVVQDFAGPSTVGHVISATTYHKLISIHRIIPWVELMAVRKPILGKNDSHKPSLSG